MENLETQPFVPAEPGAAIGRPAPDFVLEAFQAGSFQHLASSDCRGTWMVLVFYPRDFDDATAQQLGAFAEFQQEFDRRGARVVSVSRDSVQSHRAWVEATPALSGVRFPMIGNTDEQIAKALALMAVGAGASLRAVVCVDPGGIVKSVRIGGFSVLEPERVLDDLDMLIRPGRTHPNQIGSTEWKK